MWMALLNMEHKFGSADTLESVFNRAVAESKGKAIYLAMANTYEQAGDINGAEIIYNKALKRPQYKKSKKVWMAYHQFKLRTGTGMLYQMNHQSMWLENEIRLLIHAFDFYR